MKKLSRGGGISFALALFASSILAPISSASASPHGRCWSLATSSEQWLLARESWGHPTASNPKSSAFGCGQLIRTQRVEHGRRCGAHPDTVNAAEQMCMMRSYVKERYKTMDRAIAHKKRTGWY